MQYPAGWRIASRTSTAVVLDGTTQQGASPVGRRMRVEIAPTLDAGIHFGEGEYSRACGSHVCVARLHLVRPPVVVELDDTDPGDPPVPDDRVERDLRALGARVLDSVQLLSDPGAPGDAAADAPADAPADAGAEGSAAEREYQEGERLLAASRDGEHVRAEPFEAAMEHLRRAAEDGHLEAQWRYGSTRFSTMFSTQKPLPTERAAYVSSLTMLRRAALRGHPQARAFIPALAAPPGTPLPRRLSPPLDQVPRPWLEAVMKDAAQSR